MKPTASMFNQIINNRWFAVGLILAAGLLLSLVTMTFEDDWLPLQDLYGKPEPADRFVPVKSIEQLASNLTEPPVVLLTNGSHPFHTAYFKPAPKIEPPPSPPPPPPLKKVVLLYQGVYQTAEGHHKAFVKVETNLLVLSPGGNVLNDWAVAEISPQKLTLTNRTTQPTILEFNREKTLEVLEQKP